MSLPDKVDGFVKWLFEGFHETVPRGPKIFNDAILGNQHFARHEVAVIDSPIIQRRSFMTSGTASALTGLNRSTKR